MKAVIIKSYGAPETLRIEDIERPAPQLNEVLIKVHASAVNDWDWALLRGRPYIYRLMFGIFKPKVSILGAEMAGTVESVGNEVTKFKPGDRVYGDISEAGFGGFAEYVCVKENALVHMPDAMTFEQAATLPHAGLLAYQGLVTLGNVQRGDRVLINGAGGGVGVIGAQIAKYFECEVTGVDRKFKFSALESAGFDDFIDYQQTDFTNNNQKYDLILDAKTSLSPYRYIKALNTNGRYISIGGSVWRLFQIFLMGSIIKLLTGKRIQILGLKPNQGLSDINKLFVSNRLKCFIDGPYTLGELPMALQRFGEARHIGKIVIIN